MRQKTINDTGKARKPVIPSCTASTSAPYALECPPNRVSRAPLLYLCIILEGSRVRCLPLVSEARPTTWTYPRNCVQDPE
jgi:hypothetical protein